MEYQELTLAQGTPILDAFSMPVTHQAQLFDPPKQEICTQFFTMYPQRVSEKLLQNKQRKIDIECKLQQEKQGLLERRRKRQIQICQYNKKRDAIAQELREAHLRSNSQQNIQKQKDQTMKVLQRNSKLQASNALITHCRQRVEEKKNDYVIRIQTKTRERHQRAHHKRQMIKEVAERASDEVHFEEWRQYQASLMRKRQGKPASPDRLYQQFKKKNVMMQTLLSLKSKQNQPPLPTPQPQAIRKSNSSNILLRSNRKAQFYGIHQEDMIKQTLKDITKMRRFIQEHTISIDPTKDQGLVEKFQTYLLRNILK